MPSTRRIRNAVKNVTGGGGGGTISGLINWGPNFGQEGETHKPQFSHDGPTEIELIFDNQHTPSFAQALAQYELIFNNQHTPAMAHAITEFQRNYDFGSNAVTQTAVGARSDWTNLTNAQGQDNGTNATIVSNVTGARGGRLDLNYVDIPDYTTFGFTVVSAHLDFYTTQAGTVLANGGLSHQYDVGGSIITLESFTGNKSGVSTYDITSAITNQTTIDSLTTYVRAELPLAATQITCTCDAVILRLVVTHD